MFIVLLKYSPLEATYLERTGLRFEPSDYFSFGLADKNGFLTNAEKLMTDQHTVYNSRMFCTRWNSLENTRRVQRNLGVLTPIEKHKLCLAA